MTIKEQVEAAKALTFHDCCSKIANLSKMAKPKLGLSVYAVAYATAGLKMLAGSREAQVQAGYIVSNLASWRHPDAPMIRARLKQLAKKD